MSKFKYDHDAIVRDVVDNKLTYKELRKKYKIEAYNLTRILKKYNLYQSSGKNIAKQVYTEEFKDKVAKDFLDNPRHLNEIATKYNVSYPSVSKWIDIYLEKNNRLQFKKE